MELAVRHSPDIIRSTVAKTSAAEESSATVAAATASIISQIVLATAGSQNSKRGENEKCLSHDLFLCKILSRMTSRVDIPQDCG